MKFNHISFGDLSQNMKQFEIDLFDYARDIITASENGKLELASMLFNEAQGYTRALLFNDLITREQYSQLSDFIIHNYLDWSER